MSLLVAVVLGLAAYEALTAARLLEQARADLPGALGDAPAAQELTPRLERADATLARAERLLSRPATRLVAAVPMLGRSWVAERRVVEAGRSALSAARTASDALPELRGAGGSLDLDRVRSLGKELSPQASRAQEALEQLRDTPTGLTPPQVGRGVHDAVEALEPAVAGLVAGATGAQVAPPLLGADGPRSVLVTIMNNAELRGAGGYVSTFATGTLSAGRLELEPFQDVKGIYEEPEQARPVPAPADYVEDYGPFLANTTNWRTWTMSPHVPDTAAVGAEIAAELLGRRPDVVLLLDTPAVAALVGLTGQPVVLPDGTGVPPERLVESLLVDAYADAGESNEAQDARRADLRAAAGAAAAQLLEAGLDPLAAVRELARLASGRHLAVWSAQPTEQQRLVELGLAGAVAAGEGDLAMVSVNNLSGNKLDYYVDRTVEHDVVLSGSTAEVVQRVQLHNDAPEGLVPYVEGYRTPGRSSLRVELSTSPDAVVRSLTVDGQPAQGGERVDDQRRRIFTYLDLIRGQSVELELRYEVPAPDGRYALRALPQGLARDATLTVTARADDGSRLAAADGFERVDGVLRHSAPWSQTRELEVAAEQPGRWTRMRAAVQRFWDEPVS